MSSARTFPVTPFRAMLDKVNTLLEILEPTESVDTHHSDVFEGVFLTLAGVKTVPTHCKIDEHASYREVQGSATYQVSGTFHFRIRDLTPDDVETFKKYLNDNGIHSVDYKYHLPRKKGVLLYAGWPPPEDVHEFSMPYEPACDILSQLFEAGAKRLKAEENDPFRRYKDQMRAAEQREIERQRSCDEQRKQNQKGVLNSLPSLSKAGMFAVTAGVACGLLALSSVMSNSSGPSMSPKP